jgi:hypothetical protein
MSVLRQPEDRPSESMARNGPHETSIADIAARAWRATVHENFGDERSLLAGIGQRGEQGIVRAIATWVALPACGVADAAQIDARGPHRTIPGDDRHPAAQVVAALPRARRRTSGANRRRKEAS